MPRRSYQQTCPLARGLDAVGERWTLLIVRELLLGPLRYGELQERLAGIGTNLLADRLTWLEKLGLVEKLPENGAHRWSLTDAGRGLEAPILAMTRWGMRTRLPAGNAERSRPEWDLLAMKALFRPGPGSVATGRYQLDLNGLPAILELAGRELRIRPGRLGNPDAEIEMDSSTGWQLATGALSVEEAERTAMLKITGDREGARRLLECFAVE
ncbi:MAG: winged helix-turn-helix transcriptional regulator [Gammaproteobacteria bacterium]|jgi:DNA-binding HxlR family transcriptional regulator